MDGIFTLKGNEFVRLVSVVSKQQSSMKKVCQIAY